jgi:hypothetical protein
MLMNNTSYRKQTTGPAKIAPFAIVVRFSAHSFRCNLEYAFLQNNKDFIN